MFGNQIFREKLFVFYKVVENVHLVIVNLHGLGNLRSSCLGHLGSSCLKTIFKDGEVKYTNFSPVTKRDLKLSNLLDIAEGYSEIHVFCLMQMK